MKGTCAVATIVLFVISFVPNTFAQPVGIFEDHFDSGNYGVAGDATFDPQTGMYEIQGGGVLDESYGHLVYSEISGDFSLKAKVVSVGPRAGYLSVADNVHDVQSSFYSAWVEAEENTFADISGTATSYWKEVYGGADASMPKLKMDVQDGRVQIVREGDEFSMYYFDLIAEEWILYDIRTIEMTDPIHVCMGSWNTSSTANSTAHFSEVEFIVSEDVMRDVWEDYTAAHNTQDVERLSSHWAEDFTFLQVPTGTYLEGKEAVAEMITGTYHSFPDFSFNNKQIFVSENILVAEVNVGGTHVNDFGDLPATGLPWETPFIFIVEFNGTKLQKATEYFDYMPVMQQLGFMPVSELPLLEPTFEPPAPEASGLGPVESVEELISRFNTHDLAHWVQMVHPDVESTISSIPVNREAYVALLEMYFAAFSDMQGDITRSIDLGDGWVLTEIVYKGTNDGPYLGNPPSNLFAEIDSAMLQHFDEDGLLTHINLMMDNVTLLRTIGLLQDTSNVDEWELYE